MSKTKTQFLYATLLAFGLVNIGNLSLPATKLSELLKLDDMAWAKSSGGRTRSGSFKSSPSTSNSSSSPTKSNSNSSPSNNNSSTYSPSRPNTGGNTVIAPVIIPGGAPVQPSYNNGNSFSNQSNANQNSNDGAGWIIVLFTLLIIGGIGFAIFWAIRSAMKGGSLGEIGNDKVTVSKLQVALLAEARAVQTKLNEISTETDTDTPEGLAFLVQESALALLRTPENWAYVASSSESMSKDKAEDVFNRISLTERSKFSSETLVNVNGRVRNSSFTLDPNEDPAAYIVVTLLIGTEHDKPLFGEIKTREALQAALENVAGVAPEYLLVFELLWSPQAENDSLTYDELLTEYTDMLPV